MTRPMIGALSLGLSTLISGTAGALAQTTTAPEQRQIGQINDIRLLTREDGCDLDRIDQYALLIGKGGPCYFEKTGACPIMQEDLLLLSGVQVDYVLCNQDARSVRVTNGPIEYGFLGDCEIGVTETLHVLDDLADTASHSGNANPVE